MEQGIFEREVILEITEKVDTDNSISTRLELEVEYYEVEAIGDLTYRRRKNSKRTIIVDKNVDGDRDRLVYEAEGFVDASRLMDIHTDNFLESWSKDKKTKINFVGNSL